MVCLGFEPGAAGWKARTNPLSYGGTPTLVVFTTVKWKMHKGFGCGSFVRAVAFDARGLQFESSHQQHLLLLTVEKTVIKNR